MGTGTCVYCGARIEARPGRGRTRRYCTQAHRQAAYRQRSESTVQVPTEMAVRPRWVRWKPIWVRGRWTKMPLAVAGGPAKSTDPATWSTYREALAGSQRIGFVLGEGIGCIDLDHAIDDDGHVKPWARRILDHTPATYVEVSASGHGLHIFGHLPEAPGRARHDLGIEVYSRQRYIAVTGQRFEEAPLALADIREVVASLT